MNQFRSIKAGIVGVKHRYSKKILLAFQTVTSDYVFARKNARKPNSRSIKYCMVKLGHELGYRVYANGLSPEQMQEQFDLYQFVNREFLYDIHWYKDKKGAFYMPETISLVAESELGDRRKGDVSRLKNPAVMFDFQKLLAANAGLRLMIFNVKNMDELDALDTYFEKAIKTYRRLEKGAIFLFVCFVHDGRDLYYTEKYKA